MKKTIKIVVYVSAALQIIGGLFAIYVLYKSSFNPGYPLFESLLSAIPIIILNLLGGLTILLIKTPKGVILSLVNYLTQLFQFHFFGFYYFNVTGPYVGIGFVKKFGQGFSLWWDKAQFISYDLIHADKLTLSYFAINLIALLFLVIIIIEYMDRKGKLNKKTVANKGYQQCGLKQLNIK